MFSLCDWFPLLLSEYYTSLLPHVGRMCTKKFSSFLESESGFLASPGGAGAGADEHVLDGGLAAGVEGGHGAVEEAERRGDPPQLAPLLVAQPVDHHVQVDVESGNCYNKSNE